MVCPNCKIEVNEENDFCQNCGVNLKNIKEQYNNINNNVNASQSIHINSNEKFNVSGQNKKKPLLLIMIMILEALVMFGVVKFIYKNDCSDNKNELKNISTQDNNSNTGNMKIDSNNSNIYYTNDNNDANIYLDSKSNSKYRLNYDSNDFNVNAQFLMAIKSSKGNDSEVIVNGQIQSGKVKVGDKVQIIGLDDQVIKKDIFATINKIDKFGINYEMAQAGELVTIYLEGVNIEDIEKGKVLVNSNSMNSITRFDAMIDVVSKEAGGRHTPFFSNYNPTIIFYETIGLYSTITLQDVEMAFPGDVDIKITVELLQSIGAKVGTKFQIVEGSKVVAYGQVTKIY